jgi:hypothetical protein
VKPSAFPLLLLAAALAGPLAGCGDASLDAATTGAHSVPGPITTQPAPAARETDRSIARAAVLQLSDFGAGWRIEPDNDGKELHCRTTDWIERNPEATSDGFGLVRAHSVMQDVTVLRSATAADAAIDALIARTTLACFARQVETIVRSGVRPGIRIGRLTIERLPAAAAGDRTEGARLTIPVSAGGVSTHVYGDLAFTRVGRGVSMIALLSQRLPADGLRAQLAARAAERLVAALARGKT